MKHPRPYRRYAAVLSAIALIAVSLVPSVASAQDDVLARCEIIGTDGDDVLVGTNGDDIICGLGGNDTITGGLGNDELIGGTGADHLSGGDGDDVLRGEDDDDELFGGPGHDELRGGNGDDIVVGGAGDDELRGGNEADTIAGGVGDDELRGGNGNDSLRGAGDDDLIFGGPGEDIIRGGDGNDRLRGGPEGDICLDTFVETGAQTCEFGRGGDDREVAVAQEFWNRYGNAEFVYEMSITTPCLDTDTCGVTTFADVVRVDADGADGPIGAPAFSATELFALAEQADTAGRKVVYDASHGLPTLIDNADGSRLAIDSIELRDDLRARYDLAVLRWTELAVTDYSYSVETTCFCPFVTPLRITVRNSQDASLEQLDGGTATFTGEALTIDEHLANLGELLDGRTIALAAEFDELGIPTNVQIDIATNIADDERSIRIFDFGDESPDLVPVVPVEAPVIATPPTTPTLPEVSIVRVGGIEVAEEIAEPVEALLAAATADGFSLHGGGFRDPQRQIELRRANCGTTDFDIFEKPARECNPPTARPGQSQHEVGLAIDFTNNGRLVTSRDDAAFVWLAANAGRFGFINLPSEPWHWSTTGN